MRDRRTSSHLSQLFRACVELPDRAALFHVAAIGLSSRQSFSDPTLRNDVCVLVADPAEVFDRVRPGTTDRRLGVVSRGLRTTPHVTVVIMSKIAGYRGELSRGLCGGMWFVMVL